MANYKIYLYIILVSIILIRVIAVTSRYTREIKTAREVLNSLGGQVIETDCGRIDGFLFDNYDPQYGKEFDESIAETSPYPLGEVETPVLVIDAEDDPYSNIENVRGLAEKFPNVRLVILPDGGHPHLGYAEEVNAEIKHFLSNNVAVLENNR